MSFDALDDCTNNLEWIDPEGVLETHPQLIAVLMKLDHLATTFGAKFLKLVLDSSNSKVFVTFFAQDSQKVNSNFEKPALELLKQFPTQPILVLKN